MDVTKKDFIYHNGQVIAAVIHHPNGEETRNYPFQRQTLAHELFAHLLPWLIGALHTHNIKELNKKAVYSEQRTPSCLY